MTEYRVRVKKRTAALRPVGQAVRPVVKRALPKSSAAFHQLFDVWADIAAGTEAQDTIPEKLLFPRGKQDGAVLHLWARTGAQATEVAFNKAALLRRINTIFGYACVADLRVTAFPVAANRESPRDVQRKSGLSCQSLDKNLGDISNPTLKAALADLGGLLDSSLPTTQPSEGDHHA
jgi:hypothetical protein